mgnify:CR=1 FL=1
MQISSFYYQSKGFLIIELLAALGLLATFTLLIFKYQLQVSLYQKAAEQLYTAVSLCEDVVEELWSGQRQPENDSKIISNFVLTTICTPGPLGAYHNVEVIVNWTNVLQQSQKISLDAICVY